MSRISFPSKATSLSKAENRRTACDIDMLRSLKKTGVKTPDGDAASGRWNKKSARSTGRTSTRSCGPASSGCSPTSWSRAARAASCIFRWRQPRIGSEKFYGAILPHHLEGNRPRFQGNFSQIGDELKLLAPAIKDTRVVVGSLHPLQPRQRLDLAAAEPAEQIFQPARTHPAHLQRASRPEHPRGFRAPDRGFVALQNRHRAVACICFPPARPTA
jgi:hypothetical protein